jgi:hypothetical protein
MCGSSKRHCEQMAGRGHCGFRHCPDCRKSCRIIDETKRNAQKVILIQKRLFIVRVPYNCHCPLVVRMTVIHEICFDCNPVLCHVDKVESSSYTVVIVFGRRRWLVLPSLRLSLNSLIRTISSDTDSTTQWGMLGLVWSRSVTRKRGHELARYCNEPKPEWQPIDALSLLPTSFSWSLSSP